MFVLDTNVCIELLNGTDDQLIEQLERQDPRLIFMSSIVKAELYHWARKSRRIQENLLLITHFCEPFNPLPFDNLAAEHYGQILGELETSGLLIGPNDLLIAASSRSRDFALVTPNQNEFSRVTGLRLAEWG